MKIQTHAIQTQKQILAPSMQQSIEVLLLPVLELDMAIETELQDNPLLEPDDQKIQEEKEKIEELLTKNQHRIQDQLTLRHYHQHSPDDEEFEPKQISRSTPLEDYLIQQLHLELDQADDIKIGEMLITHLDENGYLQISLEDVAEKLNIWDLARIEKILRLIQHFDPLGVAARNLEECLCTQIPYHFNGQSQLIETLVKDHLERLGKKQYNLIARKMKISEDLVRDIAKKISCLEPRPGLKFRNFSDNIYIKPDITIFQDDNGEYSIQMNTGQIPYLRINPVYERMLRMKKVSSEDLVFIKEKIKNGLTFIKSIEQRKETLKKIAEYILDKQKEFFENGHMGLKPMTLKDVAQHIERNESTVCRAINNKYIETPQGLHAMKFFFSQGISQGEESDDVSNRSIKEELKTMVEGEDKSKPLSDQEITEVFRKRGIHLARRTVSKYRKTLHILPSHLRKN